jgi:hypothetical protein
MIVGMACIPFTLRLNRDTPEHGAPGECYTLEKINLKYSVTLHSVYHQINEAPNQRFNLTARSVAALRGKYGGRQVTQNVSLRKQGAKNPTKNATIDTTKVLNDNTSQVAT